MNNTFTTPPKINPKNLFEKHGVKIAIGIGIIFILTIIFYRSNSYNNYTTVPIEMSDTAMLSKSEKRIQKLKNIVINLIKESDKCTFFVLLKVAENEDYREINLSFETSSQELTDGGILIYTSNFFIPSPKTYARLNHIYGLPLSFFYKFYFDKNDNISSKYFVVDYDSHKTTTFNFKISPVEELLYSSKAKLKIEKWKKVMNSIEAQQKKEHKNNESKQKQAKYTPPTCQEEKQFITDVYNTLKNSIDELENQYKKLSDLAFGSYIALWNMDARDFDNKYRNTEFNCYSTLDFDVMLGAYQQAGLEFVQFSDGRKNDYLIFKAKIKENYKLLMENKN